VFEEICKKVIFKVIITAIFAVGIIFDDGGKAVSQKAYAGQVKEDSKLLNITPKNIKRKMINFNNNVGISDFSISETKCGKQVKATCNYSMSGNLALIVSGDDVDKNADSATIIFANGSDPMKLIFASGALIGVTNPNLSPKERGAILLGTVVETVKSKEDIKLKKDGLVYHSIYGDWTGLWFTVEKE
jgi:hypothetical protein